MKTIWKHEFFRFILVGGLNTVCYYLLYLLFYHVCDWYYLVSHWAGTLLSMVFSFFLNSYFTYGIKPTWRKFLQFPLTQLVNITVSSLLVYVFVEWLGVNGTIAPLAAVLFTVPITFIVTSKILKSGGEAQHEN